jgi:hypothetical protein
MAGHFTRPAGTFVIEARQLVYKLPTVRDNLEPLVSEPDVC